MAREKWFRMDELVGKEVTIISADSFKIAVAFDGRVVELRAYDEPDYHGGGYAEIEAVEV